MNRKQQTFTNLVAALTDDLYRYAYWLCKDPTLAEDLVQETMLRAWKSIDRLRDTKAVKAWLITTLRREHARLYERKRLELVDIDSVEVTEPNATGPAEDAQTEQLRMQIWALPLDYREPLALQLLMGYSISEISALTGASESAITSRLFRARRQLQEQLLEQQATTPPVTAVTGNNRSPS